MDTLPESDASANNADAELSLEQRLGRLEQILASLESQDLELDRALGLFEEGVRHVRAAQKTLAETELRVEELLGGEGAGVTRPFQEDEQG